jgi:hypothetical protein
VPHQNFEHEHAGEAHVHDHSAPASPRTKPRSRKAAQDGGGSVRKSSGTTTSG